MSQREWAKYYLEHRMAPENVELGWAPAGLQQAEGSSRPSSPVSDPGSPGSPRVFNKNKMVRNSFKSMGKTVQRRRRNRRTRRTRRTRRNYRR